jgi:hypothetical protein
MVETTWQHAAIVASVPGILVEIDDRWILLFPKRHGTLDARRRGVHLLVAYLADGHSGTLWETNKIEYRPRHDQ